MGTKRKPILLLALFIMLVVSLTGCETVLAILETPLFPQYYTNEQGIAFVSSPEQVFTVKISDPLILEIPITRSGYYEFINMEHPDILLYMGLYSKNIDKKDIIAENIIGDKPLDRVSAYLEEGESYLVGIGTLADNLLGRYGYFQLKQVSGPTNVEPVLMKPVEEQPVPEPMENPAMYIPNPEQQFSATVTDDLVFEIPVAQSGIYDFINLSHPEILLYMALFSMEAGQDEALIENVIGDNPQDRFTYFLEGGKTYLVGIGGLGGSEGSKAQFQLRRVLEDPLPTEEKPSAIYIENPEKPFSGTIAETFVFEIPVATTGTYEFINLDHTDISLYMALFSMDEEEPLALNIVGDEVIDRLSTTLVGGESYLVGIGAFDEKHIGTKADFLLQRTREEFAPPPATEPVPVPTPVQFGEIEEAFNTATVSFVDPEDPEVTAREMPPFRDTSEEAKNLLSGSISGVLTKENSPYLLKGGVTVASGASLVIEEGVVIRMAPGSLLQVNGNLETQGKPGSEVVFVGENSSEPGSWGGLYFLGDSTATLQSTRIIGAGQQNVVQGAWRTESLIATDNAQVTISDSEIANGNGGGIGLGKQAKANITSTTFTNLSLPLNLYNLTAIPQSMTGNRFLNLSEYGIRVQEKVLEKDSHTTLRYLNNLPYIFSGSFTVEDGAILDIERFTSLKFARDSQMIVRGMLNARGQDAHPVIFTSYYDDVGFDTNNDGKNSVPSAGIWGGILYEGKAGGTLEYVSIRYAGSQRVASGGWREGALLIGGTANPVIRNSEILQSAKSAVTLFDESKASITKTTFKGSSVPVLVQSTGALATILENNSYIDMERTVTELSIRELKSNSSVTLQNWDNLPYILDSLTIKQGAKLTIEAGSTLKFRNSNQLIIKGTLIGKGDENAPITLTSYHHDIVGDSNGDGAETKPQKGSWVGLTFVGEGKGELAYARIFYAGAQRVAGGGWREGSIVVGDNASMTLTKSSISNSNNTALQTFGNGSISVSLSTLNDTDWVLRIADYSAMDNSLSSNTYKDIVHEGIKIDAKEVPSGLTVNIISEDFLPVVSGNMTIRRGAKVNILGILKMEGASVISNEGTLHIEGTGGTPSIITSYKDDLGGDTNADGEATKPAAGDWVGIVYNAGSSGILDSGSIMYAGQQSVVGGVWKSASVITRGNSAPLFKDGEIRYSGGDGILILDQSSPSLGTLRFSDIAGADINR